MWIDSDTTYFSMNGRDLVFDDIGGGGGGGGGLNHDGL